MGGCGGVCDIMGTLYPPSTLDGIDRGLYVIIILHHAIDLIDGYP